MFVSDLRHFLDMPADAPGPARRMAEHLTSIVRAATAGETGPAWTSALTCGRRPGRQVCAGHIAVPRTDVPPTISWRCTSCGDEGVISGWENSPFDLRPRAREPYRGDQLQVIVPPEAAATLRSLLLLDTESERLVFRATVSEEGIVLAGDEDDLDELIGYIAAEANHEQNRRRQKLLDVAFSVLGEAVDKARHT